MALAAFARTALALAVLAVIPVSAAADTYTYDALGRLTRTTYDNGVVVQYSYDAAGNRSQVVTTGVAGPNGAPVAVNDTAGVNVSAAVDIMVRANDSDPNGDTLSVTAVGTPTGGGTVVLQGGGTHVRYTAPATAGARTFTYTISDGHGGTDAATVTVTVTATAPDTTPAAFDLGGPTTAEPGAWAQSATVTITGINAPAGVTITNGQYRINGGAWSASAGTITAGQTIQVQVQALFREGTTQLGTLTVGGVSDGFSVTALGGIEPCVPPAGQEMCEVE